MISESKRANSDDTARGAKVDTIKGVFTQSGTYFSSNSTSSTSGGGFFQTHAGFAARIGAGLSGGKNSDQSGR